MGLVRKLAPSLWWVFGTVIVGLVGNIYANKIGAWLDKSWLNFLMAVVGVLALALIAWVAHRAQRKHRLLVEFDLCTTSENLTPENLGFKTAKPGQVVAQPRRPYYSAYIPRTAVPFADRHCANPEIVRTEAELVAMLERGDGILLVGVPTEGKSRTLFEIVKRVSGFTIVRPRRSGLPSDDAIALLRGKKIICLLDDISSFVGGATDLYEFFRRVAEVADCCVVAGATRDGPELEALQLRTTSLYQLFEVLQYKWLLRRPSNDDKAKLALLINETEGPASTTLGSICMRGALELMLQRFSQFDAVVQDCYRSIQLLVIAGIEPLTHVRIHNVFVKIFLRDPGMARMRDCLAVMARQGFLLSGPEVDPVSPEFAYFSEYAANASYSEKRLVEEDIQKVVALMVESKDRIGLSRLAWACSNRGDTDAALKYYEIVLQPSKWAPDVDAGAVFAALFGKAISLADLKRFDEANQTLEFFIEMAEPLTEPHVRGLVIAAFWSISSNLREVGKHAERVLVLDRLVALEGDATQVESRKTVAKALIQKANTLREMGRFDESVVSCDALIANEGNAREFDLRLHVASASLIKARALEELGKADEAIAIYEELIVKEGYDEDTRLRELVAKAFLGKAGNLVRQRQFAEGFTVYGALIEREGEAKESSLREQVANAWFNIASALGEKGPTTEAIQACDFLIEREGLDSDGPVREIVAKALVVKANNLCALGSIKEGIEVYDALIARDRHMAELEFRDLVAMASVNKGLALKEIREFRAAIAAYDMVIEREDLSVELALREQVAKAFHFRGVALSGLRRHEEAIASHDILLGREWENSEPGFRSLVADSLVCKGVALGALGRCGEALEAFESVIVKFGESRAPFLQRQVCEALIYKAHSLAKIANLKNEEAIYNEVIARVSEQPHPMLLECGISALVGKALILAKVGRVDQAIVFLDFVASQVRRINQHAIS